MLVSVETSGGFAGLGVRSALDTDDLGASQVSAAQVSEALRVLDGLAASPPVVPPGGASQPRYRLTVHRPGGRQVVEVVESQVPAALRPLLTELLRKARE